MVTRSWTLDLEVLITAPILRPRWGLQSATGLPVSVHLSHTPGGLHSSLGLFTSHRFTFWRTLSLQSCSPPKSSSSVVLAATHHLSNLRIISPLLRKLRTNFLKVSGSQWFADHLQTWPPVKHTAFWPHHNRRHHRISGGRAKKGPFLNGDYHAP